MIRTTPEVSISGRTLFRGWGPGALSPESCQLAPIRSVHRYSRSCDCVVRSEVKLETGMMVITRPTDLSPLMAPFQLGKVAQVVDEDSVAPYLVMSMWSPALKPDKHTNLNYFGSYVNAMKPREADRKNANFSQTKDTSPSPILYTHVRVLKRPQPRARAAPGPRARVPALGPEPVAPGFGRGPGTGARVPGP